jgi:DNA replication protein DnaC
MEKLYQMRLVTMAEGFKEQMNTPSQSSLSFEERFGMIVDREWTARENRKLQTRLKAAHLKLNASIEDIDYRHPRGLDKSLVLSLASCQWIKEHHNIIITGPTGIGKTYIAEAFANKACREGHSAVRFRSTRLLRELAVARGDGSYIKLLTRLAKMEVLIIDDWGLTPLSEDERKDFLEVMEDRHGLRSTIITSQYPVAKWHDLIGEPTLADAILDRIVHNAHKFTLKGESLRKTKAKLTHPDHQR